MVILSESSGIRGSWKPITLAFDQGHEGVVSTLCKDVNISKVDTNHDLGILLLREGYWTSYATAFALRRKPILNAISAVKQLLKDSIMP